MAAVSHALLLTLCHYIFPFSYIFYFIFARVLLLCNAHNVKARRQKEIAMIKTRLAAVALQVLLVMLFVAEAILYISRALLQKGWWAPHDFVMYTLLSVVAWGAIGISFIDSTRPVYSTYTHSWCLAFMGEATITTLTTEQTSISTSFARIRLGLQSSRLLVLVGLVAAGFYVYRTEWKMRDDEERQVTSRAAGLVGGVSTGVSTGSYGTIKSFDGSADDNNASAEDEADEQNNENDDEDSDDADEEMRQKRQKRLTEDGGWLGYLRSFAVFFPILNPIGNHRIMAFYSVLAIFTLWDRFETVLIPNQLGIVTDKLTETQGTGSIPWKEVGIWIMLRYIASSAGLGSLRSAVSRRITRWQEERLQTFAFNHVMSLSMDFHNDKDSGEVLRAVQQGWSVTELFDVLTLTVGPALVDLVVAMFYVTYLFDIYVAFIIGFTGVLYLWISIRLRQVTLPSRRLYVKKARDEGRIIYESVSNWQTVSYFNREAFEKRQYGKAVSEYLKHQVKYLDRTTMVSMVSQLILITGHLSVAYLAIYRVSEGDKPVGSFVTLVTYWSSIIAPLSKLANEYRRFNYIVTDAERLLELINTKPSVTSRHGAPDLKLRGAKVEFRDVSFHYKQDKPILSNVTFTAEPGTTVALVGETGAGKSTIFKVLFRYVDVISGSIHIDGQDIREVTLDSLRDRLGVVPQDPAMFNRSIRENVRYARLDASDGEVEEACRLAAIHDKIMTFPKKYNSKVGERGVKLSGGELQRLAIARVLLKNPSIVMLDEATSAVDSGTEKLIQASFRKLTQDRTTFVIAHRLSTIVEADQILVVDDGRIVQTGTHQQLLRQSGRYRELWLAQVKGESMPSSISDHKAEDLTLLDIVDEVNDANEVLRQQEANASSHE